jgi:hypothetical protein
LANFTNEAAKAAVAAAKGEKVDAKWGLESKAVAGADQKLSGAKPLLTTVEVEAIRKAGGYVRTNAIVFPDGRVRWVQIDHRPSAHVGATEGLDSAEPRLAKTTAKLIEVLSGDKCELPLMSDDEKAKLPAPLQGEMKDPKPGLDKACGAMKGVSEGWTPRYDDFTVLLDKDGAIVSVRSSIRVKDGKLALGEPRLR